jgi:hypothetical protein
LVTYHQVQYALLGALENLDEATKGPVPDVDVVLRLLRRTSDDEVSITGETALLPLYLVHRVLELAVLQRVDVVPDEGKKL